MLDLEGIKLTSRENELLTRTPVGGVILFRRNYVSKQQLKELVFAIREIRPEIIVTVDQEGGPVQRFIDDFTLIPPMAALGQLFAASPQEALIAARQAGWLLATELQACGIDLSFTPVLDINLGLNEVIGKRAFSDNPDVVVALASALIDGLHAAGMPATGKHFPGHGSVTADSHLELPIDTRDLATIKNLDMLPFKHLVTKLDAVMPAHIIYSQVDSAPAGFSKVWIKDILRGELGFDGVVFSDDLCMEAAGVAGDINARAQSAFDAGCDMVLVCNQPQLAEQVAGYLETINQPCSPRLLKLRCNASADRRNPDQGSDWQEAVAVMDRLNNMLLS